MANSLLLILLLILFIFFTENNVEPKFYKNVDIEKLRQFKIANFKKRFGDTDIFVSHTNSKDIDVNSSIIKMKLNEFCNIMNDNIDYYFKTEDEYDFLNIIGIKKMVIKEFDKIFNNFNNVKRTDCSFWLGGKGSTTGWHVDIEDLSYLYVIEGKKKIQLISPKYNDNMYEKKIFTSFSKWSEIDFKNIDYNKYPKFKDVEIQTYILNDGDAIFIPRNWWHCVENLNETIAITYKIFRTDNVLFYIMEFFRKYYAIFNNYKFNNKNAKEKISKKDLLHMKKLIANNINNH